ATDVDMDGTFSWQGATLAGLSPGTYTFTYIPIGMPTQTWQPKDGIILSSSVFLNAAIVGGSFKDNSTTASYGAASILDDIADSATGAMEDLIEDLQALDADEQQAVLQRLAPQTSQAVSNAGSQAVSGALDSVSARL